MNEATSETVIFAFEGAEVRTVMVDGAPWLVARDVCDALGLTNITEALRGLSVDEFRDHELVDSLGRRQPAARVVNEPGPYRLIFRSRRPEAEQFKRWVFHEVLPALRQTGRYVEPGRAEWPASEPVRDLGEVEARLRILDLARSMAVLPVDDIRHQAQTLLADVGMAERPLTVEQEREAAVLRWIHQRPRRGETVSIRDIYRGFNGRSWVDRAADVEPTGARLVEAGHLAALPKPPPRRGRPPSPQFEVLTSPDGPHLMVVCETAGGAS